MRICSIITSFTSGGAEMLACNLSAAFVAAGHQATLVSLADAASLGNPVDVEQAMRARMTARGVSVRSLSLSDRGTLAGAAAMRRMAAEALPDIIHVHTARALPMIALALLRRPVILTHHNSRLSFPPAAYRLFDRIVSAYVAISDQCAETTRRHARRPVRMILNAASADFAAAAPRVAPARDPVILAVGTPSTQKDYLTLIRAARPLAAAFGDGRRIRIRIAGGGAELGALIGMVRQEGVADLVEPLGARSDVRALMAQADLYANSSLWEGFPIALIEAAMSGLPIVATDVAGNREMVTDGANGCLVPPGDPVALAAAMAALLADPAAYAACSGGAIASARRFSIDGCAAAHLTLYADALGTGRRLAA